MSKTNTAKGNSATVMETREPGEEREEGVKKRADRKGKGADRGMRGVGKGRRRNQVTC